MITNETRAKLLGVSKTDIAFGRIPPYDTDANAVAELRAFVRARGKMREFMAAIITGIWREELDYIDIEWDAETLTLLVDATPQQQTAAFDTVFRDDLERINET